MVSHQTLENTSWSVSVCLTWDKKESMDGCDACVFWRHHMIVSLWHEVVVCLCLFNLQRKKKWKVWECCGVWCLCVLEARVAVCLCTH